MFVTEMIAGLEAPNSGYKREEIDWAMDHREEVVPYLLEILEQLLADPHEYSWNDDYWGYVYAAMLLGHFREPKAHDTMLQLMELPGEVLEDLFGDMLYENVPMILVRTCGGDIEGMLRLLQDGRVSVEARGVISQALTLAVAAGFTEREPIMAALAEVLGSSEGQDLSAIAYGMAELCPKGWMHIIEAGYQSGAIDSKYIELDEFEAYRQRGVEECLGRLKELYERNSLDDLHARMSWWASFQAESDEYDSDNDDSYDEQEEWLDQLLEVPREQRPDRLMELLKSPLPGDSNSVLECMDDLLWGSFDIWFSQKAYDKVLTAAALLHEHNPRFLEKTFDWIDPKVMDIHLFNRRPDRLDLRRFEDNPGEGIDGLIEVLDKLIFYGHTEEAVELSHKVYSAVRDSPEVIEGAEFFFADTVFSLAWQNVHDRQKKGADVDIEAVISHLQNFGYDADELYEMYGLYREKPAGDFDTLVQDLDRQFGLLRLALQRELWDKKGINFPTTQAMWSAAMNSFDGITQKRRCYSEDEFFNLDEQALEEYADRRFGFLSNKQAEAFVAVWGMPYVYDFLLANQWINKVTHALAIEKIRRIRTQIVRSFHRVLWQYNFVHSWIPADSLAQDEGYAQESQWFAQSYTEDVVLPEERARNLKIGRNDPCFCGSGLKYKRCCLK